MCLERVISPSPQQIKGGRRINERNYYPGIVNQVEGGISSSVELKLRKRMILVLRGYTCYCRGDPRNSHPSKACFIHIAVVLERTDNKRQVLQITKERPFFYHRFTIDKPLFLSLRVNLLLETAVRQLPGLINSNWGSTVKLRYVRIRNSRAVYG
jgi:hypothetical protein